MRSGGKIELYNMDNMDLMAKYPANHVQNMTVKELCEFFSSNLTIIDAERYNFPNAYLLGCWLN